MKIKQFKLTPDQLLKALQSKAIANVNLPSDIELLELKYDLSTRQITAFVRSDSFEDTSGTSTVPELALSVQVATKPVTATAALIAKLQRNPEVKPNAPPQPQASQDADGLEREFSAEQRKVLRFSVNGDFVVVKPTQFLKTEWEDINDVVVGLGGRWVKGDIINYWEIPRRKSS